MNTITKKMTQATAISLNRNLPVPIFITSKLYSGKIVDWKGLDYYDITANLYVEEDLQEQIDKAFKRIKHDDRNDTKYDSGSDAENI